MKSRGKQYNQAKKGLKKMEEAVAINEAIEAVKKASYSSFDGTIELKVNLNTDPKDSEQNVRFVTELPHPTGRKRTVLVFGSVNKKEYNTLDAIEATDKTVDDILSGKLAAKRDFDIVVADAKEMPKIAKVAKVLGPKGLMPSPKTGTVGDVNKIIASLDKGQVEVRSQPGNRVVHMVLGTVKTDTANMAENFNTIMAELKKNRPSKVKKVFIESAFVKATMSPSVKVVVE